MTITIEDVGIDAIAAVKVIIEILGLLWGL